jgi:beta-phosphoglucomutase-like phosphatase (HAD superfamily)
MLLMIHQYKQTLVMGEKMNIHQRKNIPDWQTLSQEFPHIQCVLFDMDGTLFNTEPLHAQVYQEMLKELLPHDPISLEKVFSKDFTGFTDEQVWQHTLDEIPYLDLSLESFLQGKNQGFIKLSSNQASKLLKSEIKQLLSDIARSSISIGLVTSSEKITTNHLLKITELAPLFQTVTTRDCVDFHKPHPMPYSLAIEKHDLAPHQVLVVEDSEVGIEAARASGVRDLIHAQWF